MPFRSGRDGQFCPGAPVIAQLDLFSVVSALQLPDRLYAAGLDRQTPVILHANRRVLVSLTSVPRFGCIGATPLRPTR